MRSLKTPAKRPPLGPRVMDTPAKREIHLPFTARTRLFTSTASAVFTPQRTALRTPGWHESRLETEDALPAPFRLGSRTSPARHGEDTLSEEVLKSLFARHAKDVSNHGPVVAFERFVRGVQRNCQPHREHKHDSLIESEAKLAILQDEYEAKLMEAERKHEITVAALQEEIERLKRAANVD